jgi:TPP-dependent pyruvate/acetoin dehydrogenase alpha subunit
LRALRDLIIPVKGWSDVNRECEPIGSHVKYMATKRSTSAANKSSSARSKKSEVSQDQLMSWYKDMLLIRRFEEKAGQLYGMGLIAGFCHLYIGQEAVVVGVQAALERGRPGDHRLSRPRPHAGLRHGSERA